MVPGGNEIEKSESESKSRKCVYDSASRSVGRIKEGFDSGIERYCSVVTELICHRPRSSLSR